MKDDLAEIQQMWNDCELHPDKCPGYNDKETRDMMQDAVDGFMSYLKPEKSPAANMRLCESWASEWPPISFCNSIQLQ